MKALVFLLFCQSAWAVSPMALSGLSRGQPYRFFEEVPTYEQVVEEFDSTNGITIITGTGAYDLDTTDFKSGTGSVKCNSTANNTQFTWQKTVAFGTLTDLRAVRFWSKYSSEGAEVGRVQVRLSSNTAFNTAFNFGQYINGAGFINPPPDTWVLNTVPLSHASITSSEALGNNFIRIQIRFDLPATGTNAGMWIDKLSLIRGGKSKSILMLEFDNGPTSIYTNAFSLLQTNGFPATISVGQDLSAPFMSTAQLKEAYSSGWDIINKGTNNAESIGNSTYTAITNSLISQKVYLESTAKLARDDSSKTVIWAGGAGPTNANKAMLDIGFLYGRRTSGTSNMHHQTTIPWSAIGNRSQISVSLDTVTNWVGNAFNQTNGQVVLVWFEKIVTAGSGTDTETATFQGMVDFMRLNKDKLTVMTIPQWNRDRYRWLTKYDRP